MNMCASIFTDVHTLGHIINLHVCTYVYTHVVACVHMTAQESVHVHVCDVCMCVCCVSRLPRVLFSV